MRVMHIEAGKHLYGGALQVHYLTRELASMGVENYVVCPFDAELLQVLSSNVVALPIKMKGDVDIGLIYRLKQLLKIHKIDLVHVHSRRGADLFGLIAAKLSGVPVVVSRRVDNSENRWFARWKYHSYNHVISISEGIRQVLLRQGIKKEHVTTVISSVDTQKFRPVSNAHWFQSEFGLDDECITIGVLAQLIKRKGHSVLFKALVEIVKTHSNIEVLIFGKGPIKDTLQEEVLQLGLTKWVRFVGFRTDIEDILPNLDLVVHPAFTEGLGVSLLQASACGVPIIASKVGGIPEAVRPAQNGLLVDVGDSKQLADAVIQLISSYETRQKMATKGRELALTKFSTQTMAKGNLAIYQKVLGSS